jgi:hypothetical protein
LQSEVFFSPGAGGWLWEAEGGCPDLIQQASSLPAVLPLKGNIRDGNDDFGSLCLLGFSLDQIIRVGVFRPDGSLAGSAEFYAEDPTTSESFLLTQADPNEPYGLTYPTPRGGAIELILWLPQGVPEGRWHILALARDETAIRADFTVGPHASGPGIDVISPANADPLTRARLSPFKLATCPAFHTGETADIAGHDLPPGETFPFGLYRLTEASQSMPTVLQAQSQVHVDETGAFEEELFIDPAYPAGYYFLLLVKDSAEKQPTIGDAGPYACLEVIP